jgi:NAD+ kinase
MQKYRRIGISVKPHMSGKDEAVKHVIGILEKEGFELYFDRKSVENVGCTHAYADIDNANIDVLLVIGGDGTILRAVRELKDHSIPVLSVNRGAVGFLAEIMVEEADELLPALLSGYGEIEERTTLSVTVSREGKDVFDALALNEAAISQGAIARLLDLRTDISGEPLATFHADGLIVATPTGSTAYSLAAGGPVVHPRLSALILTPINPHSLTQKPIVIPGGSVVGIDVLKTDGGFQQTHVSLTVDGQVYFELSRDDRVTVTTNPETVKFIRRREDTFFHTLRTKLRWGERL